MKTYKINLVQVKSLIKFNKFLKVCYAINKKYSVLNSVKDVCMKKVNRKGLCEKLLFNLKLVN